MPASHLQPITDVAKPVSERAASCAQAGLSAVMTIRAPHIGKASAKVSTTSVSESLIARSRCAGRESVRAGSSSQGSRTG